LRKPALIAIAFVLCSHAIRCTRQDTFTGKEWARTVEPRLSAPQTWQPCRRVESPDSAVDRAQCGAVALQTEESCDETIVTHNGAMQLLASKPACIDKVVAALEGLAHEDAKVTNDLSAAYYVRAQLKDQPIDLLYALRAAEPGSFNRALTLEALGLQTDAIAAWDEFQRRDASEWADEARARRDALRRETSEQWTTERLYEALADGNPRIVRRLVERFPATAQTYMEDTLLRENPARAQLIAGELFKLTNDPYFRDVVQRYDGEGLALYSDGRKEQNLYQYERAAQFFKEAAGRLAPPLNLVARLRQADSAYDLPLAAAVIAEARRHRYESLHAVAHLSYGAILFRNSAYAESLKYTNDALAGFRQVHDDESIARALGAMTGTNWTMGQYEPALRQAIAARRYLSHSTSPKLRHKLFGDTAATIDKLDFPEIALLYQNEAVRLGYKWVATGSDDARQNLAVALRERAGFEVRLDKLAEAQQDLQASAAVEPVTDPTVQRAMQARLAEMQGRALTKLNPDGAIAAFTRAILLSSGDDTTRRAGLYIHRATAQRLASHAAEAEADLQEAFAILDGEERALLRNRPDSEDVLWDAYFSRFQEPYRLLIRQLIDERHVARALQYADHARGFEPLSFVPVEQRRTDLRQIQQILPRGTLIVEYAMLNDRTFAWLITRDAIWIAPLGASRADVARWAADLALAKQRTREIPFEIALLRGYAGLIAPIRGFIDRAQRLVIVPDGAMHGIPFAALRDPRPNGHYLIEDVPVEIAGSAALYATSLLRDAEKPRATSALLIGNPAFDGRLPIAAGLQPLRFAAEEVQEIAAQYPGPAVRMGRDATAVDFVARARNAAIVHIAAHAVADPKAPSKSAILFAPSPNDSGVLDATQLLKDAKLDRTRLVVLASCSSAGGVPLGPVSVAPLVRPLIAHGVPAVVGTLWNVDDATAKQLLVSFHRRYREGNDAAIAMQGAQIALLHSGKRGLSPALAWAPFQVIGHASSPFAAR
jgi:CHAT domain-containing protein